jgi:hypothetical protein
MLPISETMSFRKVGLSEKFVVGEIVSKYYISSQYLPIKTKENYEKTQSSYSVS